MTNPLEAVYLPEFTENQLKLSDTLFRALHSKIGGLLLEHGRAQPGYERDTLPLVVGQLFDDIVVHTVVQDGGLPDGRILEIRQYTHEWPSRHNADTSHYRIYSHNPLDLSVDSYSNRTVDHHPTVGLVRHERDIPIPLPVSTADLSCLIDAVETGKFTKPDTPIIGLL